MRDLTKAPGFWGKLKRPILMQAPMADVTDAAYRLMIARRGMPDAFFTEFVSTDGLCSRGRPNLVRELFYHEEERPVVAHLFGDKPEKFYETAQLAVELGFDGIDINMGCPVKIVTKTGSGAALIKTPKLAQEIIRATIKGAADLPVSVKTRIGWNQPELETWIPAILETEPAALIMHLRTRKEMSLVDAHWELAETAVKLCEGSDTILVGNGDVRSLQHAAELTEQTGVDGCMLGRAIFGNPWLYDRSRTYDEITLEEKLDAMIEHSFLYENIFRGRKNFAVMQKHLRAYANGFDGAKQLRTSFDQISCATEVYDAVTAFREERGIDSNLPLAIS